MYFKEISCEFIFGIFDTIQRLPAVLPEDSKECDDYVRVGKLLDQLPTKQHLVAQEASMGRAIVFRSLATLFKASERPRVIRRPHIVSKETSMNNSVQDHVCLLLLFRIFTGCA
jgi:hypothetical protein